MLRKWITRQEPDNLVKNVFGGCVFNRERKIIRISWKSLKELNQVSNYFLEFYKQICSSVFRTHWNRKKNVWSLGRQIYLYWLQNTHELYLLLKGFQKIYLVCAIFSRRQPEFPSGVKCVRMMRALKDKIDIDDGVPQIQSRVLLTVVSPKSYLICCKLIPLRHCLS